jgi:hypothetical protein
MRASGGADQPEAICCAFYECLSLNWEDQAVKIAILITDAPPHGIGNSFDLKVNDD